MTEQEKIDEAVKAERKRCYDLVMAARMGEADTDFRSILHRITSGAVHEPEAE